MTTTDAFRVTFNVPFEEPPWDLIARRVDAFDELMFSALFDGWRGHDEKSTPEVFGDDGLLWRLWGELGTGFEPPESWNPPQYPLFFLTSLLGLPLPRAKSTIWRSNMTPASS